MVRTLVVIAAIFCSASATGPAFAEDKGDKPNAIERTANRASKFTAKTATRAAKFTEKTATRAGKFVEKTATRTGNFAEKTASKTDKAVRNALE